MKTSITVIDLACEKSDLIYKNESFIQDIKEENYRLKKNLEECLNVLRLDDFSRDYITEPQNLKILVSNVVNINKREFIYNKIFPKVNIDEKIYVYTDNKWCTYMLEQIISNAIKYSEYEKENKIDIFVKEFKEYITLTIKDYGIGIKDEDLSRVFDPFFTGENGRKERSASGIGLYMVKIISKKLGHEVFIESEYECGTEVNIRFKKMQTLQNCKV